jgi:hypothetical protein
MKVLVFDCRKVLEINCRKMYVFACFLHNQLALESIKKSLYSFWDDKSEAVRWLGRKQAAQWNEPCFGAIEISRNRIAAANMPKFAKRVIYGRWGYYIIIYQKKF